jgi:hypothetical protein
MKKIVISLPFYLLLVFLLTNCSLRKIADPTPAVATGSVSASFNGAAWKGEYAGALVGGSGNTQILTLVMQLTEKDNTEYISIGVSAFTGVGSFSYGGTTNKATFRVKYKNKDYSINQIGGNAGTGTIKITEYVNSNGILNPGKVVGEFSGTIKSTTTSDVLIITSGKFTAIKYL